MEPILAIVVPCFKEEAVLSETTKQLTVVLEKLTSQNLVSGKSFILYVNDGSRDKTWPIIESYYKTNKFVCGVNLAGNVGHQNALIAGLSVVKDIADIMITIDADLQDDVNVIQSMVLKYAEGNDIVYGVRKSRATDTWFKRTTALGFYSVMRNMGVKSVYNHADYRLMSKIRSVVCTTAPKKMVCSSCAVSCSFFFCSLVYDTTNRNGIDNLKS